MRRPALVAAALISIAWAGFAASGCGGGERTAATTPRTATTPTTTSTPTTGTTAPAGTVSLRVYFLRDGRIATVRRAVPRTRAVGGAALAALAAGPAARERKAGLTTAIPADTAFNGLRIEDGLATVTPPAELSAAARAQLVYTLTQFPTVSAVQLDGRRLTRADFEAETPIILVESPAPFDTISSPLRISGTANTFEATLIVELRLDAGGGRIFRQFATATSGSGTRGTYDVTIPFTARGSGPVTLVAYEESAKDGSPIHRVEIPLVLRS